MSDEEPQNENNEYENYDENVEENDENENYDENENNEEVEENNENENNENENNEEENNEEENNDNDDNIEEEQQQEPYYQTYSMQQFFNRVKTVPNTENCYTANFAMKDEVKVDGDVLLDALKEQNDESGQFDVEFEENTYTFAYVKNSDLDYMSCLRTSGNIEETIKMLGEIDNEWQERLNDINIDDRKDSDWMGIWSSILSPYATSVKVVKQEQETIENDDE